MSATVSDFIVDRLHAWGVRRIFGYPGDGINGLLGALERADGRIGFVQVRHEETSAFMACAHAKFTGETGVCLATSGPGAIHLLNGLYDAKLDRQPVVAIVGQATRASLGGAFTQEVDLLSLFKDVAGAFVQMATTPQQVRHLIDRAMRIAAVERTVTCVILPNDLQELPAEMPAHEHGTVHSGIGWTSPRVLPHDEDLRRAADVLNAGTRVAMLIGAGARGAFDEVVQVAEVLGAGVAKALLGKDALPDDLPFVTGSIGLLGTRPSWDLMTHCDTLLVVGSSFPYAEFLPQEGRARGVQIDRDGRMLGLRYPMEVNLAGDAAETLRALLPYLERKTDRSWRERVEASIQEWTGLMESRAMADADPVNPQRVFWEASSRLPDDCIITCDSGTAANWYARDIRLRRGMQASLSGTLATMGSAVPYAIAAKYAYPDRPVIAFVGDGAMQMNGLNELITVAKYWHEWADPRLVIAVLNNRDLNLVTWEQRVLAGNPRFDASQDLPDVAYGDFARTLGLHGTRVDHPDALAFAWDDALAADRPMVLDFVVDPNVPPLPPHVTMEQARAFLSSLWAGDASRPGLLRQTIRQVTEAFLPHKE